MTLLMESLDAGVWEVQKGLTIHRAEGEVLWASRGNVVWSSADGGRKWEKDGTLPFPSWRRFLDPFPSLKRISRGGVLGVWPQGDGTRICVVPKMILRAEAGSSQYRCVFRFSRGFRPLNLCQGGDDRIYWGEYFLNLKRSAPVHIFGSKNAGRDWKVAFTFPQGSICHVHRIVYDPYEDAFIVSTGDRDAESGIWKTMDEFRTLKPLGRGNQRYRTVSLIVRPHCILYGTDSPRGDNYIMAMDRRSGAVDEIQKVPGPVLYASQVGGSSVFATMVENRNHEVSLWEGNENSFRLVKHFRVWKRNQLWREMVGYSTVILPEGRSAWPNLFCTPIGTRDYADRLIRMTLHS